MRGPVAWPEAAEVYTGGPDAEFLQGLYATGESEIVAKGLEASRLKMTGRPGFGPVLFLDRMPMLRLTTWIPLPPRKWSPRSSQGQPVQMLEERALRLLP